jgi:hypothetical protein
MTDSSGAGVMDQGDHLQEDNEDMTCTICLESFEAGQDLSFSRDLKCHHCFHRDWYVWLDDRIKFLDLMNQKRPKFLTLFNNVPLFFSLFPVSVLFHG